MFGEADSDIQEPEVDKSEAAILHRMSFAVFDSKTSIWGRPFF
jgi:hypothetical protein